MTFIKFVGTIVLIATGLRALVSIGESVEKLTPKVKSFWGRVKNWWSSGAEAVPA